MVFFEHLHITILVNALFKSRSILHPFLTIQTGTPRFLFPSLPWDRDGWERDAVPKLGPLCGGQSRVAMDWILTGSISKGGSL